MDFHYLLPDLPMHYFGLLLFLAKYIKTEIKTTQENLTYNVWGVVQSSAVSCNVVVCCEMLYSASAVLYSAVR